MSDFEKLKDKLKDKLTKAQSSQEVETVRSEIFGKNGLINLEFKKIGSLPPEDAKKVANSGCNGVIVGSTFVKYIQDNLSAPDLTQSFGKQVKSFSEVLK